MPKIVIYDETTPVWFAKNVYVMAKIDVYCLVSVIGWDIKMTSHHIQIQMQVLETFVIAEFGDDRQIWRDRQNWRLRSTGQRAIWNEISYRLTKCIKLTKMKMTKIIVIYQLCLEQFFFFFFRKICHWLLWHGFNCAGGNVPYAVRDSTAEFWNMIDVLTDTRSFLTPYINLNFPLNNSMHKWTTIKVVLFQFIPMMCWRHLDWVVSSLWGGWWWDPRLWSLSGLN